MNSRALSWGLGLLVLSICICVLALLDYDPDSKRRKEPRPPLINETLSKVLCAIMSAACPAGLGLAAYGAFGAPGAANASPSPTSRPRLWGLGLIVLGFVVTVVGAVVPFKMYKGKPLKQSTQNAFTGVQVAGYALCALGAGTVLYSLAR